MKLFSDIKIFRGARMNFDSALELLEQNETLEVRNMVEDKRGGFMVNMRGFDNVMELPINSDFTIPDGTFKVIGTRHDVNRKAIVYCLCDTTGTNHSIFRMFTENRKLEWVVKNEPLLNFKEDHRVTLRIIGDLLYGTDNYEGTPFVDYNPPWKVNMVKACGMTNSWSNAKVYYKGMVVRFPFKYNPTEYHCYRCVKDIPTPDSAYDPSHVEYWELANVGVYSSITKRILDRVKYPPEYAPVAKYGIDTGKKVNALRGGLYQFATRYVMDDNEKTKFSSFSNIPIPSKPEYLNGAYDVSKVYDNVIQVAFNTGPSEVVAIDVAVRLLNTGPWVIAERVYKFDENGVRLIADNINRTYSFYNSQVSTPVDQVEVLKVSDAVPQVSKCIELTEKDRIVDANYVEGYDNVRIDMRLYNQTNVVNMDTGTSVYQYRVDSLYSNSRVVWQFDLPFEEWEYNCITVDFENIIEKGYNYYISVNAFNSSAAKYIYEMKDIQQPMYPSENYLDRVIGDCVTTYSDGDTVEEFINRLIYQLRVGNGGSESVIGFCYDGNTSSGFHLWGAALTQGDHNGSKKLTTKYQLGLLISGYGITFQPSLISITLIKSKDSFRYGSFKSGANHQFGIVYKDRAKRAGAVNTSQGCLVSVPMQTEITPSHAISQNVLKWEVFNKPPIWAKYWQPVYALSNVSYFVWGLLESIGIAAGANTTTQMLYFTINKYFQDTKELFPKFNVQNYQWQKGDKVRFLFNKIGNNYMSIPSVLDFEIIGDQLPSAETSYLKDKSNSDPTKVDFIKDASGNKIPDVSQYKFLIQNFDYASYNILAGYTIIEIYRPRKTNDDPVFYEFGDELPIINPGTANAYHSGGNGTDQVSLLWQRNQDASKSARGVFVKGDVYLLTRLAGSSFPCESDSYSDFYDSNAINIGKRAIEWRDMRRTRYKSKLIFSGPYIQNTRVNELSTVNASDSFDLQEKFGEINGMVELGYTLKVIQENKTQSIFVGRAGITQPSAQSTELLTSTKDVLGTLITPDKNYGTMHPFSVASHGKRVWYFDYINKEIIRDAGNGQQPISTDFKFKNKLNEKLAPMGDASNIDMVSGWDQQNELVYLTFIDKTNDGNSFTVAFKDTGGGQEDGFVGFFDFIPDAYGVAGSVVTSWKDNAAWWHNSQDAPRSTFYGRFYKYWVTVVTNKAPLTLKRLLSIFVSTNNKVSAPNAGDIAVSGNLNNPGGMVSLIKQGAFSSVQGKQVADFGKNMTTNQSTPELMDLVDGEDLAGQAASVRLEGEQTTEHRIFAVEINGVTSEI